MKTNQIERHLNPTIVITATIIIITDVRTAVFGPRWSEKDAQPTASLFTRAFRFILAYIRASFDNKRLQVNH